MTDEPLEVPGPVLGGLQHLLVIRSLPALIIHHSLVCDEGQSQDAQAAVTSHHHLRNCAHTWTETSQRFIVPVNKEPTFPNLTATLITSSESQLSLICSLKHRLNCTQKCSAHTVEELNIVYLNFL